MLHPATVPTIVALYLFWVLGLYVITRSPRATVSQLAAGAQFSIAFYLFGETMQSAAADPNEWRRWQIPFWSGVAPSAIFWAAVAVQLVRTHGASASIRLLERGGYAAFGVVVVGEALFAVLGLLDGPVYRWSEPTVDALGFYHGQTGPLYPVFAIVTLLATSGAVILLTLLWCETRPAASVRPQVRWLIWSGVAFLISATYLSSNALFRLGLPTYVGHITLAVGMIAMAWNVAQYSALLEGEVLRRDFLYYLTGSTLYTLFFVVVYVSSGQPGGQRWLLVLLVLVLGATAIPALLDTGRYVLDKLFFSPEVRDFRQRLLRVAVRAARQPSENVSPSLVLLSEESLQDRVADAMRKLHSVGALGEHPLLAVLPKATLGALGSDADSSPSARGRGLQTLLLSAVERLKPEGQRPSHLTPGWLQYLALEEEYVNGRPNKELAEAFHVSEATFHRARRQAIAHLTAELAAEEQRASQAVTSPSALRLRSGQAGSG